MNKISQLVSDYQPSLTGGGGITLAAIMPDPTNISQVTQIVIALVTVITQIIHLFKKNKNV